MDDSGSTSSIVLSFLFDQACIDDVVEDSSEYDLDLITGKFRNDLSHVFDGLWTHRIVLRINLFHESFTNSVGHLGIVGDVDLTSQHHFCYSFSAHLHVVRIIVGHLVDEDLYFLLAHQISLYKLRKRQVFICIYMLSNKKRHLLISLKQNDNK